jgi:sugar lactone lactonase YvrE
MRKLILILTTLSTLAFVGAAAGDPRPSSYVLPGDRVFPEGIAFQPKTGFFFVSSTGDGTIFRGHVASSMTEPFLAGGVDGRTTAIGLELDGTRLFVAGGTTGQVWVYDTETRALLDSFTTGSGGFLNDVAVAKNGDAFVTDSFRPILWRIDAELQAIEPWLSFVGTPFQYANGFNANGIVATPDGKYLIVSQSNARRLFRIDLETKEVVQIVTDEPVGGDGLVLQGHTLYAVENGAIVEVRLGGDFATGEVVSRTTDPSFRSPTTNAIARGRMLVVNSQFAARNSGQPPVLPFTVSSIPIP